MYRHKELQLLIERMKLSAVSHIEADEVPYSSTSQMLGQDPLWGRGEEPREVRLG